MTFEESIPVAKQLAENQLKKGFDTEAFLILAEISKMPISENDLVPSSNIDECIQNLLQLFITYYGNKSKDTIKPLLLTLQQILSELYHTCSTNEEREEVKQFINNCQKIA